MPPLSFCEQAFVRANCGVVTVNDRGAYLSPLFLFVQSHSQSLILTALACFLICRHFPSSFMSVYAETEKEGDSEPQL